MTDTEKTTASEATIEEQTRAVLANALDQLASEVPGGKVRWSKTTLPTMLRPVLLDTSPPAKTLAAKRQEEQRFTSTAAEVADAIRKGDL
jgi:hypothetical protein